MIQAIVERIIVGGPLAPTERISRVITKNTVLNTMIHRWLENPEFILNLLRWDSQTDDWYKDVSEEVLVGAINDIEEKYGISESCTKDEFIRGIILIRQTFHSMNPEDAEMWNNQKRQIAELAGYHLSNDALSQSGYPSRLLFLFDVLRKLYNCFVGEIDFGVPIGPCGIRSSLHHTDEWETGFTDLLNRGLPMFEILDSFTFDQLLTYGW